MDAMNGHPFVHVLALKVDGGWRRRPDAERSADRGSFLEAPRRAGERVVTYTYSMIGTRADSEILFWRLGRTLEELEETAGDLLRSGLGRWSDVAHSMIGLVRPSSYVKERTPQ